MDAKQRGFHAHISQQFNQDLEDLKTHLLEMGGLVEKQLSDSLKALIEADSGIAVQVIAAEKRVNQYEVEIDEECTRIIALRQPTASDLRMVVAISRALTDIERIGDEANKIAKLAIAISEEGTHFARGFMEVRHIGSHVLEMVRNAFDTVARLDVETAISVAREDKQVDMEYDAATRQLVTYMMEDPRSISRVLNIMWVLRSLERVGDHAGNICEHVIYLVKGKDVRHQKLEDLEEQLVKKDD